MGNVCPHSCFRHPLRFTLAFRLLNAPPPSPGVHPDPLPARPHAHHRAPKNAAFLRAAAETQGHGGVRGGDRAHLVAMAVGGVRGGAVWDFRPVRRLFRDGGVVCRERAGCGAVFAAGVGLGGGCAAECGFTCVSGEGGRGWRMSIIVDI